jgi:hypothetical protein
MVPLGPKLRLGPHILEAPLRPRARSRSPLLSVPLSLESRTLAAARVGCLRCPSRLARGEAELRGYSVPSRACDGGQISRRLPEEMLAYDLSI